MSFLVDEGDYYSLDIKEDFLKDHVNDLCELLEIIKTKSHKILIHSNNSYPLQREGSIGEIVDCYIPWWIDMILQENIENIDESYHYLIKNPKENYNSYHRSMSRWYKSTMVLDMNLELKFDNKHANYTTSIRDIKIVKDKNEPSKYVFTKSPIKKVKKKDIVLKDKFDNEFTVGSFICFAKSTSRQQGIPCFGKVTKIHSKAHFVAESLKLSENDYKRTVILRDPENVILMTDELMDQIMMARLTY